MKRFLFFVIIILAVIAGGWFYFHGRNLSYNQRVEPAQTVDNLKALPMQIISPSFAHNQTIPAKYTCDGDNINPPLKFVDVPSEAKSLALIMDDPDAPAGTWVHWTLWNLNPDLGGIEENSVPPSAVQGKTSFGNNKYGGPCPPSGQHRYFFKLYALDTKLDLPSYSEAEALEKALEGHILQQAELIGIYGRKR